MCPRFRGSHSTSWLLGRRFEPQGLGPLAPREEALPDRSATDGAIPVAALLPLALPNFHTIAEGLGQELAAVLLRGKNIIYLYRLRLPTLRASGVH
jgi:hypothetical protein